MNIDFFILQKWPILRGKKLINSRITRENIQQSFESFHRDNFAFTKWRMIKFFGWKKMISNQYRFNRNWMAMDVKWGRKVRCKRISASTFAFSTSRGEIRKTLIRRNTRHDTITLYPPPRVLFRMETFSPSSQAHRAPDVSLHFPTPCTSYSSCYSFPQTPPSDTPQKLENFSRFSRCLYLLRHHSLFETLRFRPPTMFQILDSI